MWALLPAERLEKTLLGKVQDAFWKQENGFPLSSVEEVEEQLLWMSPAAEALCPAGESVCAGLGWESRHESGGDVCSVPMADLRG